MIVRLEGITVPIDCLHMFRWWTVLQAQSKLEAGSSDGEAVSGLTAQEERELRLEHALEALKSDVSQTFHS